MDVLAKLQELRQVGEISVLSTIVKAEGSTPRSLGVKMLTLAGGETLGTIGGGQLEHMAIKDAQALLVTKENSLRRYDLISEGIGGHCVGSIEVFHEVFVPLPQIVIFGAGHVAQPFAVLAADLGYPVYVIDERENLLSAENFPRSNITRIQANYLEGMKQLQFTPETVCFILSPGGEKDILLEVLPQTIHYAGVLGSRKKITVLRKQLLEAGIKEEDWLKVRAPVGLDLGGEAPYEVALSIVAELVKELHDASSIALNLGLEQNTAPIHSAASEIPDTPS